jgi:Ca2+-binding RTX toxin-like protein
MQNYIGSLLADVAYLNLNSSSLINGKVTSAGAGLRGWNESDRVFFNENFTITNQKYDSSGFSGCLIIADKDIFLNGKIVMSAGESSVSYRGTEINQDLVADFQMAVSAGLSLVDDINDIIQNIELNQIDELEMTILLERIVAFSSGSFASLISDQRQAALEYFENIKENKPNEKINVYGHSLGGYLANYVSIIGTNYQNINTTITFNAPGFNDYQIKIMEIIQKLENLKNTAGIENYAPEIQNRLQKIINSADQAFNPESLNKLHSIYSTTGPEFTTSDKLGMFHPELRIPLYTDDAGMVSNHFVQYLRESLCVYDSLSCLMTGDTLQNYEKITTILTGYVKDLGIDSTFKAISTTLKHIANFLGIPSSNGIDVLNFVNSLSISDIMSYNVNKTSDQSTIDVLSSNGAAILYSLMNYVPFTITGTDKITDELYNPENYTSDHIESRFDLFDKIMSLKSNQVNTSTIDQFKDYKIFFARDSATDFVYIDTYNNIMYTNDLSLYFNSGEVILKETLKTIYLKNDKTLIVNTFNNVIYDYYKDDYIALNKGETELYLSYGNDTIMVDVAGGASIKKLTIKDNGLGDLFIFNGSDSDDNITGTKYTDKIIGAGGIDYLYGGDGNDTIDGGLGNDYIFGEDGNDTLIGGDGNDHLMGGNGSNSLMGGNGDDILNSLSSLNQYNDTKGDTLSGGAGFNTLFGTGYGDTYIYDGREGGVDTIRESNNSLGINYIDKLVFRSITQASDIMLYNILNNLVIAINGINKVYVIDYYNNNYSYLDEIHFSNIITGEPVIWDTNYILQHTINKNNGSAGNITNGSSGNDNVTGTGQPDYIDVGDGNDVVNGGDGDDTIYGGDGTDTIYGGAGNDTIYGGDGGDIIYGEFGKDVIYSGSGNDNITLRSSNGTTVYMGSGDDYIFVDKNAINSVIYGDSGNDTYWIDGNGTTLVMGANNGLDYIQTPNLTGILNVRISANMSDMYFSGINSLTSNLGTFYWTINSGFKISVSSIISKKINFIFNDGQTQNLANLVNKMQGDEFDNYLDLRNDLPHIKEMYGLGGDDKLRTKGTATYLDGGSGNDILMNTSKNAVTLHGGSGNDQFQTQFGATITDTSGYDKVYFSSYGYSYNSMKLTRSGGYVLVTNVKTNETLKVSSGIEEINFNSVFPDYEIQPTHGLKGDEINQIIELMAEYESDELADMGSSDDPEIIKSYNEIRKQISSNINNLWAL